MDQVNSVETIASVIQLAIAPVFLLAGIGGILNVMSTRLGRIVDRARIIETLIVSEHHDDHRRLLDKEAGLLWSRVRVINWAIRMSVSAALLVCLVIVTLFIAEYVSFDLAALIAGQFIGAMVLLIVGLMMLLVEVSISTQRLRQGIVEKFSIYDKNTDN